MILDFWKNRKIGFYCMNHDKPIPMAVREGNSLFYACPRYFLMDKDHPDGHAMGEPSCMNRLSFQDTSKIVEWLEKRIEEDLHDDIYTDYAGMSFKLRGITVTVLEYSQEPVKREDEDEDPPVKLGILNRTALRR